MKGLFISVEGGDGSGKTTQIKLLKTYLESKGHEVILTREPGGTIISEDIRRIILNKDYMEMSDITEALLYAASRAQHVEQVIKPSIEAGKVVICDRFVDSSVVYQGHARGIGISEIEEINSYAINGIMPEVTILLDIPAIEGIKRKKSQQELDRLELQKQEFHVKVNEGYKLLAKRHPDRIVIIDATNTIENIHEEIKGKINTLI